jgi:dTMP kinase
MIKRKRGFFVTFEGIDGSGKSTLLRQIQVYFEQRNIPVFITAEPTDSSIGRLIRELISSNNNSSLSALTELFLFSADRSEHIQTMQRQLDCGKWILCDRYVDSTIAYQGKDEKMLKAVYTINNLLCDMLSPDITFLLDVDPEEALKRIEGREKDSFEQIDYLKGVRERYLRIAHNDEHRIVILDGSMTPDQVASEAIQAINMSMER